jgi:hypothetical protein
MAVKNKVLDVIVLMYMYFICEHVAHVHVSNLIGRKDPSYKSGVFYVIEMIMNLTELFV